MLATVEGGDATDTPFRYMCFEHDVQATGALGDESQRSPSPTEQPGRRVDRATRPGERRRP